MVTLHDTRGARSEHATPAGIWGPVTAVEALDVETTGLDEENDRIVSIALVRLAADSAPTVRRWLIAPEPGTDFPEEAVRVHGITADHARTHGRPAAEVLAQVRAHLEHALDQGTPLTAYNAPFDLSFVDRALVRAGLVLECRQRLRVLDPMALDHLADPHRPGPRNLGAVCAHYGVDLQDAHEARADAEAAARLVGAIATAHPRLARTSLEELQAQQRRAYADQAAARQERLRRTRDPRAYIDPHWPIRPRA
ncbi:exonuclease domain-containing protein [Nocardiopsis halophila]|uniref:exonuclease domain-containing protein n=1 Tax=Nocardiopsis halophila TaxID=141692 RepID=UPI0003499112|nr:exonuclease domain-containing protein [Nocardiopsis halophila]